LKNKIRSNELSRDHDNDTEDIASNLEPSGFYAKDAEIDAETKNL